MLSKKRQFITWLVGLIMIPLLFFVVFYLTASAGLFSEPSFYVFIFLGALVALFPIEVRGATLFLIASVSISVFLAYGLFAEMVVTTIATTIVMKQMRITREESYRFPMNILLFQIISILSAEIYYLVNPILLNPLNYPYNILSLTVYLVASITLNRLFLYVLATEWQKKVYGKIINFEYIFSLFSVFYAIPIALMILHLRNIYSTFGIIIAAFPLIGISIIFKLYFSSDSQNRYLYKVNGLAIKLNEQQNVKKIIELYLSSWNNIFPTTIVMKQMRITREESYRFPMNILLFQIISILSAEIYYLVNPILLNPLNYPYNILSLTVYLVASITLNRLFLYVLATEWQKKVYGKIINFEYIFSLFSVFYAIPIALMILHLRNIYSTFGIIIAAFPLIGISIIFKLYFSSDSQNRYLYKVNGLAIKLNEQQNVKKIIELYLSSWNNIFPGDTIYYCVIREDQKIEKSMVYHNDHIVESKESLDPISSHVILEEYWFESDMIVYKSSEEWPEIIHSVIDYPAESMLIFPIKRAESVIGFVGITDPKRKAFSKNMLFVMPVLHNFLNNALANAYNFEELKINSRTDHLTGLSNLRAFEQNINKYNQTRPDNRISIIIIDLDYFKDVNDSFGHQAGNELLKQISILLSTFVYEQEKLARYGGEEFIFFVPNKTPDEIIELAESIREKIEKTAFNTHNYLDDRELVTVNITASIGVATYPDQCSSIKELMMLADRAMYVGSKQNGRNKVATINEGDIINERQAILEPDKTY